MIVLLTFYERYLSFKHLCTSNLSLLRLDFPAINLYWTRCAFTDSSSAVRGKYDEKLREMYWCGNWPANNAARDTALDETVIKDAKGGMAQPRCMIIIVKKARPGGGSTPTGFPRDYRMSGGEKDSPRIARKPFPRLQAIKINDPVRLNRIWKAARQDCGRGVWVIHNYREPFNVYARQ